MNSKIKSESADLLFEGILKLETIEECYSFFEDLCTFNEIRSLAQRFQVAKLLSERKTYTQIADITRVSTATISRINRALEYGTDGYKTILQRLK